MRVVGFNGSARRGGNTAMLLRHVFAELEKEGIETELVELAGKRVNPSDGLGYPLIYHWLFPLAPDSIRIEVFGFITNIFRARRPIMTPGNPGMHPPGTRDRESGGRR